jgi:CheY-like chemotaxis protein
MMVEHLRPVVLYVEDNPANQRLMSQVFKQRPDYDLLLALDAAQGLSLVATHQPTLILLDINLPGIDGFDMLRILKQRDDTRDIPVVAISANAMDSDICKGRDAGFDDYLTKPLDVVRLLQVVDEILSDNME